MCEHVSMDMCVSECVLGLGCVCVLGLGCVCVCVCGSGKDNSGETLWLDFTTPRPIEVWP